MTQDGKNNNILLHQIKTGGSKTSFKEVVPSFSDQFPDTVLSIDPSGNITWNTLPAYPEIPEFPEIPDFEVIVDDKIKSTNIYYKDGRIGISRPPLKNYLFDIAVPENTLMTAFHVGDGSYGFSMGNGTAQGFIPEIIGMGSDENDAGLYFLGKSGNNKKSGIPLVVIDGRDSGHGPLVNRPILGVTSGDYSSYKFLVDQEGKVGIGKIPEVYNLEIFGAVQAEDFIIDNLSTKALFDLVKEHQREIDILKDTIAKLQK